MGFFFLRMRLLASPFGLAISFALRARNKNSNAKTFSINLATKKGLAETKITTGKLSTELKSKIYVKTNKKKIIIFNLIRIPVVNSDRLGKELRIAEENLKKDLRGKNKLFHYLKLIKF
jgi:hypothetical protein